MQRALARDKDPRGELATLLGRDIPLASLRVPVALGHALAELDVLHKVELARHSFQIIKDLRLPTVDTAPIRVWEKGEAVEMGGDVAAAAWISVLPPGAAQLGALLQDGEPHPLLLQLLAHAQAGHASPHYDNVQVGGGLQLARFQARQQLVEQEHGRQEGEEGGGEGEEEEGEQSRPDQVDQLHLYSWSRRLVRQEEFF